MKSGTLAHHWGRRRRDRPAGDNPHLDLIARQDPGSPNRAWGEVTEIADQGTFTLRTDGSWEYSGQQQQNIGTYTLAGNVLTVIVTEPPTAVSTTVWQRQ